MLWLAFTVISLFIIIIKDHNDNAVQYQKKKKTWNYWSDLSNK